MIFGVSEGYVKELELVDIWIDPDRNDCVRQLLNYAIKYATLRFCRL